MADNLVADNGISNDCGDNAEENLAQCVAGTFLFPGNRSPFDNPSHNDNREKDCRQTDINAETIAENGHQLHHQNNKNNHGRNSRHQQQVQPR